jgi:hypothetical protein
MFLNQEQRRVYDRAWYAKHKDRIRDKKNATGRRTARLLRQWLQDIKHLRGCQHCPENEAVCLDFHHRDPKSKVHEISNMVSSHRCSKAMILAEIDKCDLLCCNCHRKVEDKLRKQANQAQSRRCPSPVPNIGAS